MSTPPIPEPFVPYVLAIEGRGNYVVQAPSEPTAYRVQEPSGQVIAVPCADSTQELTAGELTAHIENPPAPVAPVPAKIGPAQLRIALRRLHPEISPGAIYAVIASLPTAQAQDDARDWYDYATEIQRTHPMLAQLAGAFDLTGDQVDAVFRLGATI